MTRRPDLIPTTRHSSPLRKLTVVEAKLLLREPLPLFWGIVFATLLFTVMGVFSSGPDTNLGGLSLVDVYEPIVIAFVTATFAVQGLPTTLASYREQGILRRLDTTPIGAARVLTAQLLVNLAVILASIGGVVAVGRLAFGVHLPRQPAGFVAVTLLADAAMLGLGLLIAALAPTGRVAGAAGAIVFFPMMFFAGLWTPQTTMPAVLRTISHVTPLGAAVQATQDTLGGHWPHPTALAALATYTVVFAAGAARSFRWQ